MAYALYTRLLRAVKASGLPYTVVGGAASRGRGTMRSIETITLHHTATPRSYARSQDYPTFNVVKNGRPELPGPLAQLGLARSGRVILFASGIANHAGRSRAASMTNPHAVGIEAEGANEKWPAAQYNAYVRLVRALLDEFDLPTSRALRHAETCSPAGRKVDASFDGNAFRRGVNALTRTTPTTPAPVPDPIEKGILGMTDYIYRGRDQDQTLPVKSVQRVRVGAPSKTHGGVHQITTIRKGKLTLIEGKGEIAGLKAGEQARVRIVQVAGGKVVYRFRHVLIVGGGNGWDAFHITQLDRPARTSGEFQLEVENHTSHALTLNYTEFRTLQEA